MRGLGRTMPITMACFAIGALSVIGLPPTGGTWSKWFLALGAAESGHVLLIAVLMISSLLNIAYLIPIPIRGFFFAAPDGPDRPPIKEAPLLCLLPICFTAVGCVVLFFFADEVRSLLAPLVGA
jgi:multicomponent Na+:H+ antiporter subunit D